MPPPGASGRRRVVRYGALWWLIVLVLGTSLAVSTGALTVQPAYAQTAPEPPVEPPVDPPPCPIENPNCGDPTFPPPPVPPTVPPPVDPPVEPPIEPPVETPPPVVPTYGTNPLWFLPPEPDFEFAYDQQNYDLWLSQCGDQIEEVVDDVADAPFGATEELPTIFWELYGDAERACPDAQRASNTLLDEAIGGDVIGRADIPTGNYDIGYDEGAWNHFSRKLKGNVTDGLFSFNKWLTGSTINLLDWAFGFELASSLASPANTIASGYYVSLNGSSVSAYDLALFVTLFYFALQLLRGRTAAAIGELAATYLIYAAFVSFVILVPGGFGQLVTDTTEASGNLAASIAAVTLEGQTNTFECPPIGGPDAELGDVICPFGKGLHSAFIERPYDLLNWGTNLGSGGDPANGLGACAVARDQILLTGPHGTSDDPRFIMGIAGCDELADFNHDPTWERAGLSLLVVITAILVLVLAAMTALTLIAAQLLLVGIVIVMPFAVVAGLMPGSGRAVLWKWVAALLKTLLTVVAIAVFLSLYLVTINLMLEATAGDSWLIQGGSLILLTLTMFWVRSRLLKASKRAAVHAGDRLSQARIGGSHGGGFFTAASAGFAGGRSRYIPYEARSAYRDARQAPVNVAEWRTNQKTRGAVRTHNRTVDQLTSRARTPEELSRIPARRTPPPRGFTASRRHRSGAKQSRNNRRQAAKHSTSAAQERLERVLAGSSSGPGDG